MTNRIVYFHNMKIPFIILTLLASCTTQEVVFTSNEQKPMNSDTITTKKDTAARFTAIQLPAYTIDDTITMDDFPVTDLMLRNNLKDVQIDSIISFDKAWFYNQKNKQVLIFEFATDYYRMETYLFSEEYLKEYMPSFLFHKKSNKQYTALSEKEAEIYLPKFITQSKRCDASFFCSIKELKIGEKIQNVIEKNGRPDTIMYGKKIEIYRWEYRGDLNDWNTEAEIKANKKIARNSFGYQVTLHTKNERIIGIHLFKEIP